MTNLNQQILKFDYDQNFKDQDFYVSNSNEHSFRLLNSWPKWDKNFINLIGEKFSGKSHLINIFLEKHLKTAFNSVPKKFTLINIIDQDNKYLIVTSKIPIVDFKFKLNDLNSRSNNFILSQIEKPGDDLIYALILKNLSDRQISIDQKLIEFIIKRIDRTYGKISDFIYKIDEISLKRKKPIDFKIIKEALEV